MIVDKVVVAAHERVFVFRAGEFKELLLPGVHWLWFMGPGDELRRGSLLSPHLPFPDIEFLVDQPEVAPHVQTWRIKDTERGLLFREGNFTSFLAPGFYAFLKPTSKNERALDVEVVDITHPVIEHPLREVFARTAASSTFLTMLEVADGYKGLLLLDQKKSTLLPPGRYYFWNGIVDVKMILVDMREQTLEIQGQELMTQDKVSLRINVTARWQVADANVALAGQTDYKAAFYRDVQLALRDEVGARTLDDLLARKEDIGKAMVDRAKKQAADMGISLLGAGLRDVILPGEMRTIFNQVIEAEKRAQANMIARREETAATRNLMNTAKLLEGNPILMRMKELETTERIAEKIGSLAVYGGLDGLMATLREASRLGPPVP
ncbi:MAG: slipin family protein [Polyangiaceae bacterium]